MKDPNVFEAFNSLVKTGNVSILTQGLTVRSAVFPEDEPGGEATNSSVFSKDLEPFLKRDPPAVFDEPKKPAP
jgi:hypothetical protein